MVIGCSRCNMDGWMALMQRWTLLSVPLLVTTMAFGQDLTIFEQPMVAKDKAQYVALLKNISIKHLGRDLEKETSPQRIRLLVAELSSRGPEAISVLEQYRKTRESKDPATRMVLAEIRIAIARIRLTDADKDYLRSLEKMLANDDIYVVNAAAHELGRIGSAEAIAALRLHEKQGRPMIKIARLQSEYGRLPPESRIAAILESARVAIQEYEGDSAPALVAESSMLAWLGESAEPFLKKKLETLAPQPSDEFGRRYRAFLERSLNDLQRAQIMKRTVITMPVATMPASTSVPTSLRLADTAETARRDSAAETHDEASSDAKPDRAVTKASAAYVQWLLVAAGLVAIVTACIVIGVRIHTRLRSRRNEER